jgi:hypothetical protein
LTQQDSAPVVDLPLDEAVESLTGFEVIAIENRYGRSIDELGPVRLLMGAVHSYANRDGARLSWQAVEAMTVRDLRCYFAAPAVDPESETGKESSDGATPTPS